MVKRKTIEERMKSKPEKKTNRDRLIQALKYNDLEFLCYILECECCIHRQGDSGCIRCNDCKKPVESWLDQEVSDE